MEKSKGNIPRRKVQTMLSDCASAVMVKIGKGFKNLFLHNPSEFAQAKSFTCLGINFVSASTCCYVSNFETSSHWLECSISMDF